MTTLLKHPFQDLVQALDREFMRLDISVEAWSPLQRSTLEALHLSIKHLGDLLGAWPFCGKPQASLMYGEIDQQITSIDTYAQYFLQHWGRSLALDATVCVQDVLTANKNLREALEIDKLCTLYAHAG